MNTVQIAKEIKGICLDTFANMRVVPSSHGRVTMDIGDILATDGEKRGPASSWGLLIDYVDSGGVESARRISLIRAEARLGGRPAIAAYCHEAAAYRVFRIDRIRAMACCQTGELYDPEAHIASLREQGLPFRDIGAATFAKVMVFLARCDGRDHPAEWDAIDHMLSRYLVRYGGLDAVFEDECKTCRSLAPDADDLANALIAISRAQVDQRRGIVRLLAEASASVIDADGRHDTAEITWGQALDRTFSIIGR